ncbi:hypothetical protein MKK50_12195 [Methylobacterium sp. J-043]|nr:hypothetical protein [Methylobacterium sp. J-043]
MAANPEWPATGQWMSIRVVLRSERPRAFCNHCLSGMLTILYEDVVRETSRLMEGAPTSVEKAAAFDAEAPSDTSFAI